MGRPDRLREEGHSEEEIIALLESEGIESEKPQNPETARVTVPEPDNGLAPYEPEPRDAGWVHDDHAEPQPYDQDAELEGSDDEDSDEE